tara:strand:- start:118 stop:471 length:354 start_codon:yes stop_codon:yes gene_type:complete
MVQLRRDGRSLDGAWRPLLSAARDGDALPLPSIFSRAPENDAPRYTHDQREEAPDRQHDDDHRGHPVLFFFHGLLAVQGVVPTQFPVRSTLARGPRRQAHVDRRVLEVRADAHVQSR